MSEDELKAMVMSVVKGMETLEEELSVTREGLGDVLEQLKSFISRDEAEEKALAVRKWIAGVIIAGFVVAISAFTGWYTNRNLLQDRCRVTRTDLRTIVSEAVVERKPSPSATPEIVAQVEHDNATRVRPLRERLLSLEGTQPEKC